MCVNGYSGVVLSMPAAMFQLGMVAHVRIFIWPLGRLHARLPTGQSDCPHTPSPFDRTEQQWRVQALPCFTAKSRPVYTRVVQLFCNQGKNCLKFEMDGAMKGSTIHP